MPFVFTSCKCGKLLCFLCAQGIIFENDTYGESQPGLRSLRDTLYGYCQFCVDYSLKGGVLFICIPRHCNLSPITVLVSEYRLHCFKPSTVASAIIWASRRKANIRYGWFGVRVQCKNDAGCRILIGHHGAHNWNNWRGTRKMSSSSFNAVTYSGRDASDKLNCCHRLSAMICTSYRTLCKLTSPFLFLSHMKSGLTKNRHGIISHDESMMTMAGWALACLMEC